MTLPDILAVLVNFGGQIFTRTCGTEGGCRSGRSIDVSVSKELGISLKRMLVFCRLRGFSCVVSKELAVSWKTIGWVWDGLVGRFGGRV